MYNKKDLLSNVSFSYIYVINKSDYFLIEFFVIC